MSKLRFVANPVSGRGKGARHLESLRRVASAHHSELVLSESSEHLTKLARDAVRQGVERLIAAGGDGTFHHLAIGLAESDCALAMIPVGRGNDLATTLEIPSRVPAAIEMAIHGSTRAIDLGRIGDLYFTVQCGVGFDSEVATFANDRTRWLQGALVYPYSALRTILRFKAPLLRVETEREVFEERAMLVVAANCPRFGGGMKIAPGASLDDGLLDLVIVKEVSRRQFLRVFPKVYRGTHLSHPAVKVVRTAHARLSIDPETSIYGDGEVLQSLHLEPIEIGVEPRALRVVAPPASTS